VKRGEVGVCGREDNKNLAQGMINSPNVRSKQGEAKAVKDYEVVWASWPNVGMNEKQWEIISNAKIIFNFFALGGALIPHPINLPTFFCL
jgi:hypothetical protein